MEQEQQHILDLVEKNPRGTLDRAKLAERLGISGTMERIALGRTLDSMEEESLLFRTAKGTYLTRSQAGYYTGVLHVSRGGTGYLDRDSGPSILIEPESLATAMSGDTVLVELLRPHSEEEAERPYGRVLKVLKRALTTVIGTFQHKDRALRFVPDDRRLAGVPITLHLPQGFLPLEGLKIDCRVEAYGTPLVLTYNSSLGNATDPGVDILSILLAHDIEPDFPQEVMDQVRTIPQQVSEEEMQGRTDLREETTVTIDGDDAKDFDDAVAIAREEGGWRLRVSIADVSHYVTFGSPLDREAYKRGCSTYVTDRVVPMLPRELSNGICSLNPKSVRLTNTCELHIRHDGSTASYSIYPSVICSAARMTYHNVNLILDGNAEMQARYAFLGSLFTDLAACADAIRFHRSQKGAIDFDTPEAEILCDRDGHPINVQARERGHAERVIEDCMIAANVAVAEFMRSHDIPCIYRVHEAPQIRRLRNFTQISFLLGQPFAPRGTVTPLMIQKYLQEAADAETFPVLSMQMLRCMQKARYDSTCLGHFGLAEENYLHFTSPIRRYPDLVVHRMLRKYFYENKQDQYLDDQQTMMEAAEQSSIRERASDDAEFDCDDMKKAEYMSDFIGYAFEGIISSVTSHGFYVMLPDTVEGMVSLSELSDDYYTYDEDRMALIGEHRHAVYQIGMKVEVRVLAANKDARTIDFGLVALERTSTARHDSRRAKPRSYRGESRARSSKKPYNRNASSAGRRTSGHAGRNRNKNYSHGRKGKG
jgi:ribonuclease R